jgi:hypothetical protein
LGGLGLHQLQDRAGFVCVAFGVDVSAQRIVGWHAATDKRTDQVLTPLRILLWDRDRQGIPVESGQLLHTPTPGVRANSAGRCNTLIVEVWSGTTCGVDDHAERPAGDAVAGDAPDPR